MNTDTQQGAFWGYANVTSVIDEMGDKIMPGAFSRTLAVWKSRGEFPPFLWQHDDKTPIGLLTSLEEDSVGLRVSGHFLPDLDIPQARTAYIMTKNNILKHLSIGYRVKKFHYQGKVRQVTDLDVEEISIVTIPGNRMARIYEHKAWTPETTPETPGLNTLLATLSRVKGVFTI